MTLKLHLPITLLSDWHVCVISLVMTGVYTTEYKFSTLIFFSISIKPEWKNRFFHKTLFNHIVPEMETFIGEDKT